MSKKWDHINSFIKTSTPARRVRHFSQLTEKKSKLKAQVIKPVEEFEYKIESFRSYLKYTFTRPQIVADDMTSGRYFLFAMLNLVLYIMIIFFTGAAEGGFNWQEGLRFAVSGLIFTTVLIVFTFFIQLISINSSITIYKVFVDVLSYYTLVSFLSFIQLVFEVFNLQFNHSFEIISFLVVMSIPTRLFISYHHDHKFEVDIFKMNLLLIVLMVMYLMFTRNIEWLNFFRAI
ncbi:hypothetical protein ERX37_04005 [Macrococcus hajekii]|uniref:Uncharacterized protein n=1 Tax=Macrococcus hajekii TaxID=198482 RepID=A0A4R6BNI5_9STAP|nr:hypothetical protein [Macrococcus hajekii]TDM03257.1 hypothetical protein ERX37_04005 [Macrococcus hajekii]GGA97366.1 hypothetical protein GCM10007190_01680 [Macrococcus hajekii]